MVGLLGNVGSFSSLILMWCLQVVVLQQNKSKAYMKYIKVHILLHAILHTCATLIFLKTQKNVTNGSYQTQRNHNQVFHNLFTLMFT